MSDVDELAPVVLDEYDALFATGLPVSFRFVRSTEKSPYFGDRYQQHIEPAGRYMLHSLDGRAVRGWESGVVTFQSPLVIAFNAGRDGVMYDETSWKARLHRIYGVAGLALSRKIRKDGYDGIVTVALQDGEPGDTREIVDLQGIRS